MADFLIDTTAHVLSDSDSDCEIPKFHIPAFDKFCTSENKQSAISSNKIVKLSSSLDAGSQYNKSNYLNINFHNANVRSHAEEQKAATQKLLIETSKKSLVLQPGFEKLESVPVFMSKRSQKKIAQKERDKTKGYHWYNMPAPEMTEEKKNDLLVLQMRQALDPKHFYKRSANKKNPKYFQVGTFVESAVDFYSSRITKKQRKQTLVDELLADAEFRQYQKKKFSEIVQSLPSKFVRRKKEKKTKLLEARINATKKNKKSKKNKKK